MVVHTSSGFTSRCYSILDAYYLFTNYHPDELVIIWPIDRFCNIGFFDAFDKTVLSDIPCNILEIDEITRHSDQEMYAEFQRLRKEHINKNSFYSMYELYLPDSYKSDITDEQRGSLRRVVSKKIEGGKDIYVLLYCHLLYGRNDIITPDYYAKIRFNPDFESISSAIMNTFPFGARVVGVHIRRGGHETTTVCSKTEDFIIRMRQLLAEDANTFFFLATDDREECNYLHSVFGERLTSQPDPIFEANAVGMSKEGMKRSIIDLLCLTKCSMILGSYTSVFSTFAAGYGNIPIEIIKSEDQKIK